jgi:hypothetical protein
MSTKDEAAMSFFTEQGDYYNPARHRISDRHARRKADYIEADAISRKGVK